jgi:hypothetical protein
MKICFAQSLKKVKNPICYGTLKLSTRKILYPVVRIRIRPDQDLFGLIRILTLLNDHTVYHNGAFGISVVLVHEIGTRYFLEYISAKISEEFTEEIRPQIYIGQDAVPDPDVLKNRIRIRLKIVRIRKTDCTYDTLTLRNQFFVSTHADLLCSRNK